jgi:hypothetical protein
MGFPSPLLHRNGSVGNGSLNNIKPPMKFTNSIKNASETFEISSRSSAFFMIETNLRASISLAKH